MEQDELSLLISASDIVLIPRIKILNSGNVFLAMTFKKIMIGPKQGNLREIFEMMNLPSFNPANKTSIKMAVQNAFSLVKNNAFAYDPELLQKFAPAVIAEQWDQLLNEKSK